MVKGNYLKSLQDERHIKWEIVKCEKGRKVVKSKKEVKWLKERRLKEKRKRDNYKKLCKMRET